MNTQLNIAALRSSLRNHDPAPDSAASLTPGARYLAERFYLPLLHEQPVKFGDLEHTRFNIDDIVAVSKIYRESAKDMCLLYRMYDRLVKTDAVHKTTAFI